MRHYEFIATILSQRDNWHHGFILVKSASTRDFPLGRFFIFTHDFVVDPSRIMKSRYEIVCSVLGTTMLLLWYLYKAKRAVLFNDDIRRKRGKHVSTLGCLLMSASRIMASFELLRWCINKLCKFVEEIWLLRSEWNQVKYLLHKINGVKINVSKKKI